MRRPRPTHCAGCKRPVVISTYPGDVPPGFARYNGRGLCNACRNASLRKGNERPAAEDYDTYDRSLCMPDLTGIDVDAAVRCIRRHAPGQVLELAEMLGIAS
jgi:hypothetical protein